MRPIAFLLLFACAARAQDSLVERFETELRALVKSVDAAAGDALVAVGPLRVARAHVRLDASLRYEQALAELAAAQVKAAGVAILVGTPPRLVAPYSAVGDAESVEARLADGREVTATRWGGDADLGVVVFNLPVEVAKDLKGVDVEADWSRLGAGSIAVATDGRGHGGGRLGLVAAAEPRLGTIDAPGDGSALFGSRGTLIGLRGGADMTSCMSCHQGAAWAEARNDVALTLRDAASALVTATGRRAHPERYAEWAYKWLRDPHGGAHAVARDSGRLVAGPVIRRVLDDLEKHGAIRHSFLGVVVGDVEGARAVQVVTVVPDSPAAAAGLTPGAKIDAVDGLACPSASFFSRALVLHRPGDEVTLSTGGKEIKVRLAERSAARIHVASAETLGLSCVDLGADLRRFLGYPADLRGVVVEDVTGGSAAEEAGIRRGDVITGGGGGAIADLEELRAALAGARGRIDLSGVRLTEDRGRRSHAAWTASLPVPEPKGR